MVVDESQPPFLAWKRVLMNSKKDEKIEKAVEKYRSRVVRVEENVDPDSLNLNPYNFKIHQKPQIETMDGILQEMGFIGAVLAVDKTRNVIDGHMRVQMYRRAVQTIPIVIFLDFQTEEEEKEAILLFDEVGNMARADRRILETIIGDIRIEDEKTRELIRKLGRRKNIDIDIDDITGKFETEIKKDDGNKEEIDGMFDKLIEKWDVNKNFIWQFSNNLYLVKGDCTDHEIINIVKTYHPDCILTDPPYGIDIVGGDGRIGLAKHFGDVLGDTKPFDPKDILDWHLPSIIWGANHFSSKLPDFPQMLVWYKKGCGNESNDFADAEIAWHSEKGVIRVFDHVWRGAARASERGVPRIHPTQKPIALFEWCISDFLSKGKDNVKRKMVLDMYGGSGTLLVAASNLGMGGICVEQDSRYVAATIQRMYNLFKRKEMPKVIA